MLYSELRNVEMTTAKCHCIGAHRVQGKLLPLFWQLACTIVQCLYGVGIKCQQAVTETVTTAARQINSEMPQDAA